MPSNSSTQTKVNGRIVRPARPLLTELWRYDSANFGPIYSTPLVIYNYVSPAYTGTVVIFQSMDWVIRIIRFDTGALLYSKQMGGPLYGKPSYIVHGGLTYICGASHAGELFVMNERLLNRWQHYSLYHSLRGEISGNATLTGNTLVDVAKNWAANSFMRSLSDAKQNAVITVNGLVKQIVSCSGATLTINDLGGLSNGPVAYTITPLYSSDIIFQHAAEPSIEGGALYFYQTGFDNQCVKLNAVGVIVWRESFFENIEPTVLAMDTNNDGTKEIYVACVDGKVHILNANTGMELSSIVGSQPFDAFLSVAKIKGGATDYILANCRDGRCYSINGVGLSIDARSNDFTSLAGNDADCGAIPILKSDGTYNIVFANDAGFVALLDNTMQTLWRNNIQSVVNSTPVVADVNGDGEDEILIFDMGGTLSIFNQLGDMIGQAHFRGGTEGVVTVGDINGDGNIEMVVPSVDGHISAYRITWP